MIRNAIISICGGHPGCNDLVNTVGSIFNMYSSMIAETIQYQNPYSIDPDLKKMEDEDHQYMAAAIYKMTLLYKQNIHSHISGANIQVVDNYLDDILLTFIQKEMAFNSKKGIDTDYLKNRVLTLISLALNEFHLNLPSMTIPYNDSNDPEKVIFVPASFDILKECMKKFTLFEYSDYLFPENPIQVSAYYACGLVNRFCNGIANHSEQSYYLFNGNSLTENTFGLSFPNAMENFETFLPSAVLPMNYNGASGSDPFYKSDILKPAKEKEEEKDISSQNHTSENLSEEITSSLRDINFGSPDEGVEIPDIPDPEDSDTISEEGDIEDE